MFMTYQRVRPGPGAADLRVQLLLQPGRRPRAPGRTRGKSNTLEWTDAVAAAALQLRDDPDGLPRGLRVQRARGGRRLPAPDRAQARRGRPARPGHGLTDRPVSRTRIAPSGSARAFHAHDAGCRTPIRRDATPRAARTAVAVVAAVFTWPLIFVGGPGDDLPGRHGRARLADDVRHQHVPLSILGSRLGRLHRAQAPALRGGRGAGHPRSWPSGSSRPIGGASMKALGVARPPGGDRPGGPRGYRVRLNSTTLAAVHGAPAQAFFALMVALCVLTGRGWSIAAGRRGRRRAPAGDGRR